MLIIQPLAYELKNIKFYSSTLRLAGELYFNLLPALHF